MNAVVMKKIVVLVIFCGLLVYLGGSLTGMEEQRSSVKQGHGNYYTILEIQQPAIKKRIILNEADKIVTINSPSGTVPIAVLLEPDLRPGDLLQVLLDGELSGQSQGSTQFEITGIAVGRHTITVQVLDGEGKVLMEDKRIIDLVKQPK